MPGPQRGEEGVADLEAVPQEVVQGTAGQTPPLGKGRALARGLFSPPLGVVAVGGGGGGKSFPDRSRGQSADILQTIIHLDVLFLSDSLILVGPQEGVHK